MIIECSKTILKMLLNIGILTVLITTSFCEIQNLTDKPSKHSCEVLNKHFISGNQNFQSCFLNNIESADFCLECAGEYGILLKRFDELINGVNPQNVACRSLLIDNNQMNFIENTMENAKRFWNSGSCSGKTLHKYH